MTHEKIHTYISIQCKKKIIKGKKIKRVYIFRYQHREKETVQKQYHNGIPLKNRRP